MLRLAVGWSEIGYLTFIVLGLLELAIPYWAERSGPMTPWHPGHIVERYGLFTIIVLGECVLATMTATQAAFEAGGGSVRCWPSPSAASSSSSPCGGRTSSTSPT